MNGLNFSDASDIRLGSSTITALYYGSTLLWPTAPAPSGWETEYLQVEALEPMALTTAMPATKTTTDILDVQYSTDKTNWSAWNSNVTLSLSTGDIVYFKGSYIYISNSDSFTHANLALFTTNNKQCNVQGNVMSLIYGDNFANQRSLTNYNYCFSYLFYDQTKIINANNLILPATTLTDHCYEAMFAGCTSLVTAPELPATTLANYCYNGMFNVCSSLAAAPELPATTLSEGCYNQMFGSCASLVTAPELPATTLATYCYEYMFYDCTSLVTAPELSATILANRCYCVMFQGCTSLVTAPELPATTLAGNCYDGMFAYCTSLVNPPELPATTLAAYCYQNMFAYCSSLTIAPELPATTLAQGCYHYMFNDCTSLEWFELLPATTLANGCYENMFNGCTSLRKAPILRATTLAPYCYDSMFYNCENIGEVKCLATSWNTGYTNNWLYGANQWGTVFTYSDNIIPLNTASGIPTDWDAVNNIIYSHCALIGYDETTGEESEVNEISITGTANQYYSLAGYYIMLYNNLEDIEYGNVMNVFPHELIIKSNDPNIETKLMVDQQGFGEYCYHVKVIDPSLLTGNETLTITINSASCDCDNNTVTYPFTFTLSS